MAIEAKYGFAIPADHRRMGAQGFLDVKRSKKTSDPTETRWARQRLYHFE